MKLLAIAGILLGVACAGDDLNQMAADMPAPIGVNPTIGGSGFGNVMPPDPSSFGQDNFNGGFNSGFNNGPMGQNPIGLGDYPSMSGSSNYGPQIGNYGNMNSYGSQSYGPRPYGNSYGPRNSYGK